MNRLIGGTSKERTLSVKARGKLSQRDYIEKVRDALQNGTLGPLGAAQKLTRLIVEKGARKDVVVRRLCRNLAATDADTMRRIATVVRLVSERVH